MYQVKLTAGGVFVIMSNTPTNQRPRKTKLPHQHPPEMHFIIVRSLCRPLQNTPSEEKPPKTRVSYIIVFFTTIELTLTLIHTK